MNIYEKAFTLILNTQPGLWPEAQQLLQDRFFRPSVRWLLPWRTCRAVGGSDEQAVPGVAAAALLQTAIMLVDDLLDGDERTDNLTPAQCANLACSLQALGLRIA